jgi:hypothetical protein
MILSQNDTINYPSVTNPLRVAKLCVPCLNRSGRVPDDPFPVNSSRA